MENQLLLLLGAWGMWGASWGLGGATWVLEGAVDPPSTPQMMPLDHSLQFYMGFYINKQIILFSVVYVLNNLCDCFFYL